MRVQKTVRKSSKTMRFRDREVLVEPGALIAGGAYSLHKPATPAEIWSFREAVSFHLSCLKQGLDTKLICMVNDFGLSPEERPKNKGIDLSFPEEYLQILTEAGLSPIDVRIFYESYLRNKAQSKDRIHEKLGINTVKCASIMAKMYGILEGEGNTQLIGFWTVRDAGPNRGLDKDLSGYTVSMRVRNYFLDEEGDHYDVSYLESCGMNGCSSSEA